MNIEVKDSQNKFVEKICKETEMNPSQLMEHLLNIVQNLYFDYERQKNAGVEKESFKENLANLFLHSFKSNLLTNLNITKSLIEGTNELLGIKEYSGAGIYNMYPDFYNRSFFYTIGYEFCVGAADMYAYKGLLIEIEINQDYIEVSHVVYLPTFDGMEITDKKASETSNLVQDFIKAVHRDEFSPFGNIEIKILPIRANPYGPSSEPILSVGIKLIVKADKATHIPSIEKIGLMAREVHSIVMKELVNKQEDQS